MTGIIGLSPGRDSAVHHRRSIRLRGYDYAQPGAYFVTVVTHDRSCIFGAVAGGRMAPNQCGGIVRACWDDLPVHYSHVELDAFVVMPNHVHGVIVLVDDSAIAVAVGAGLKPAPTMTTGNHAMTTGNHATTTGDHAATDRRHPLSEIVRAFKTFSARRINEMRGTPGVPVWQRNYHEHIIRNDAELARIRNYIAGNPAIWERDRNFR